MGKLIDADVLMTWFNDNYDDEDVSVGYVSGIIEEQPEAVGRCKDCKWYNGRERTCNDLMSFGRYWKPDDFCSYWKRRTDEIN